MIRRSQNPGTLVFKGTGAVYGGISDDLARVLHFTRSLNYGFVINGFVIVRVTVLTGVIDYYSTEKLQQCLPVRDRTRSRIRLGEQLPTKFPVS
jgi:hypothetical protein